MRVATPKTTTAWNADVESGARSPYTLFCFAEQDWITLGQHEEDVLRYLSQQSRLIDYYRRSAAPSIPEVGP